ncbi:MAG: hypothetical protein WD490_11100 [Opitutales bacterium]
MPAKKKKNDEALTGTALIKETCRRIRVARSYWDAHNNRACRGEREKAKALYEQLTPEERDKVPQVLRVWLRYRSEKYFGDHRTPPGTASGPFRRAIELIEEGAIGKIEEVHIWFNRGGPDREEAPGGADEIPEGLEWDLWLGPLPWREYHPD